MNYAIKALTLIDELEEYLEDALKDTTLSDFKHGIIYSHQNSLFHMKVTLQGIKSHAENKAFESEKEQSCSSDHLYMLEKVS